MFTINRLFFSFRLQLITITLLASTFVASTLVAAPIDSLPRHIPYHDCSRAIPMGDNLWIDDHLRANEHRLFAVDLDHQGLLNAEANRLGPDDGLPGLEVLDAQCRPLSGAFAMHRAHRSAIIGHAATYYLKVSAPPRSRSTRFRLQVAFAPLQALTTSHALPDELEEPMDEWEELVGSGDSFRTSGTAALPEELEEPMDEWEELVGSGDSFRTSGTAALPEELEEPMDEWEELVGGDHLPLLAAFSDWRRSQTPEPVGSRSGRWQSLLETSLCPRAHQADPSGTLGCASPILLGGSLRSALEPSAVDDRDTYTFVLGRRARVILQSTGDIDLRAVLIDGSGQSLVQGDALAGFERSNFRFDLTLEPGRYYLRVDSASHQVGAYSLESAVLPDGWQLTANY